MPPLLQVRASLPGEGDHGPAGAGQDPDGPLHQLRALHGDLPPECQDLCQRHGPGEGLSAAGVQNRHFHCPVLYRRAGF